MTTIAPCTVSHSRNWGCLPRPSCYSSAVPGVSCSASSQRQAWLRCQVHHRQRTRPAALRTSATPPGGNGKSPASGSSPADLTTTTSTPSTTTTPSSHTLDPTAAAPPEEDGSSQGEQEQQEVSEDVPEHDLWTPRPHPPHIGHKRQLAALLLGTLVEFSITGTILWAPVAAALGAILAAPSPAALQAKEQAAVAAAVAAAQREAANKVPVTPAESVAWLNRLMGAMWAPFWTPFLLKQHLATWQDNVAHAAPRGWDVDIVDCQLGSAAPQLSAYQAYGDAASGELVAVDCHMVMDSRDVMVVVKGKGPLGSFTATVSGVRVEGDLRISPMLEHRMLLFGFKAPPSVNVKLSLTGPIKGAGFDLSQLDFIQELLAAQIRETLVEPRRGVISLDYDLKVQEAVCTTVKLTLERVIGLPRGLTAGRSCRLQVSVVHTTTKLTQYSSTVVLQPGQRSAKWPGEQLEIELPRKDGIFKLEVRDTAAGRGGALLGSALLWVAAAQDGSTLLWAHDRSGAPLGQRWGPSDRPWRVALPLAGGRARFAELQLGVGVEPWTYKQPLAATLFRSAGPHTLVLQVVQARGLSSSPGAASRLNPYVKLQYDQVNATSSTWYSTAAPVWCESFVFEENPSMLTRRVRVEVWCSGATLQGRLQEAGSSSGGGTSSTLGGTTSYWMSAGGGGSGAGGGGSSGGGGGGGRLVRSDTSLGSILVNLDMVTETAIQDRWYPLLGGGPGEVRLRAALVPGLPPTPLDSLLGSPLNSSWDSGGISSAVGGLAGGPVTAGLLAAAAAAAGGGGGRVEEVVGYLEGSLLGSSTSSLMVEVLTARLYLPLSSMDSEEEAQLLYAVTYRGAAALTRVTNSDPSLTSGVTACRAIFPLASEMVRRGGGGPQAVKDSTSGSSSSSSTQGEGQRRSKVDQAAGAPLTRSPASFKSFALDLPSDMDDDTSTTTSGSNSAARNSSSGSGSSAGKGATAGRSTASAPARSSRVGQPPAGQSAPAGQTSSQKQVLEDPAMLVVRCYDPEVSGEEDIGAVAVDVERWLAGGGANWEGWVKLDKDGGHILLRLSYLSSSEPGDILPPPRRDSLPAVDEDTSGSAYPPQPDSSSTSSSSKGGGKDARGDGSRMAASSSSTGEEGEGSGGSGLLDGGLGELLQKGYSDVKGQAAELTHQLEEASATLGTNLRHWWSDAQQPLAQTLAAAPSWAKWNPFASSSKEGNQQQQQPKLIGNGSQTQQQVEGKTEGSEAQATAGAGSTSISSGYIDSSSKEAPGATTTSTSSRREATEAAGGGTAAAVGQAVHVPSSVDHLATFAAALGWTGNDRSLSSTPEPGQQQQQQQQQGKLEGQPLPQQRQWQEESEDEQQQQQQQQEEGGSKQSIVSSNTKPGDAAAASARQPVVNSSGSSGKDQEPAGADGGTGRQSTSSGAGQGGQSSQQPGPTTQRQGAMPPPPQQQQVGVRSPGHGVADTSPGAAGATPHPAAGARLQPPPQQAEPGPPTTSSSSSISISGKQLSSHPLPADDDEGEEDAAAGVGGGDPGSSSSSSAGGTHPSVGPDEGQQQQQQAAGAISPVAAWRATHQQQQRKPGGGGFGSSNSSSNSSRKQGQQQKGQSNRREQQEF